METPMRINGQDARSGHQGRGGSAASRILLAWLLGAGAAWTCAAAERFTESCPLGNGRIGAMAIGGAARENMVLNELTLWPGSRQDADRAEIRRLLMGGKHPEAQARLREPFTCKGPGSSSGQAGDEGPYGCFQVLGLLGLAFEGHAGAVEDCRRELDLDMHSN